MDTKTDIVLIETLGQVPTTDAINSIQRGRILKLVFGDAVQNQRIAIGHTLKDTLLDFQIGIHTSEPVIAIQKLITNKEIEDNQIFFEQCGKDYRRLAEKLLFMLVDRLDLRLNSEFPIETFNKLKMDKKSKGKVDEWEYFVHGFHCGFENCHTGQVIEVPLVFGLEFGDLDPYFFTRFIKSTPEYKPLPVEIFEDYADGQRINEKMISLGKFERISSKISNHYGIVVKERENKTQALTRSQSGGSNERTPNIV